NENIAVIVFKNKDNHERSLLRMEICKEIIGNYTSNYYEIESIGENKIERAMYCIHLGDWISVFLAEEREVDAVEVEVIDKLKGELKKN
ncbi:MAG: SIS domain-containing protein, partial [Flavobacteriales bacterium]